MRWSKKHWWLLLLLLLLLLRKRGSAAGTPSVSSTITYNGAVDDTIFSSLQALGNLGL